MQNLKTHYRSISGTATALFNRRPIVVIGAFFLTTLFVWYETRSHPPFSLPATQGAADRRAGFDGAWNYMRDRNNLLLDREQCQQAFPGLFEEVDRAVGSRRHNHISVRELDSIKPKNGYVRAMIYDQEV
jgi:hypothetical protein